MTEEQVFLAALDLPDGTGRAAYLDKACGGDAQVRRQVEALLAAHFRSGEFLDVPVAQQVKPDLRNDDTLTVDGDAMSAKNDREDESEDLAFLTPSTRPDSLGRLGHYEMLQVLGRGGFGIVFRAFDDILQRVVAVKVMAPQIATLSPARKRFVREARSSAAVRHDNVVQVYEVGEQPLPYLTMEFIPGETLQQRLDRSGPLDVTEILRIGRQIAEGLAAAHACDLIHRDIKPGNILLEGGSHKVKITDFGLARAADDASISQSGIIAGTPMFMAPEQALGHHIDQRADLFSLGSVLYQMASGRPPFRAPSTLAVLKRVAEEPARPIPEIIPETPDWLCGIITKLHAKKPEDRFQSAREVADLLADCEAKLKAKQEVRNVLPAAVKPVPRQSRRIGGKWKWAAAVALVLLLGAGWFGRAAMLYVANRGELELLPQEGLVSVIVLQNDEGVFDGNKLHAPVTDWLDMKKSHTLKLPPGRYQLNVGTWPAGILVSQWEVITSGPFGSHQVTVPVINTKAIVTVERGHRVTLRAVMRDGPPPAPVAKPKPLPLPPTFKNSIGMEFVIVPKGKSWLGGGGGKLGGTEVHFKDDFYLGVYEVTQEEWQQVTGKNPSSFSTTGFARDKARGLPEADLKRFPVETVSWEDTQEFINMLNQKTSETGWRYRLPTEAEWEYACRGGPMSDKNAAAFDYYFLKPSDTLLATQANFQHDDDLKRPCMVGQYAPNRLGLFDMHGNVWEWCDDGIPGGNPDDKTTAGRVLRGGSWSSSNKTPCRALERVVMAPTKVSSGNGLRVARVPSGASAPQVKTPPDTKPPVEVAPPANRP